MAITKDDVINLMNERLKQTTLREQISKHEHEAPVLHALIASLVEMVDVELAAIRKTMAEVR